MHRGSECKCSLHWGQKEQFAYVTPQSEYSLCADYGLLRFLSLAIFYFLFHWLSSMTCAPGPIAAARPCAEHGAASGMWILDHPLHGGLSGHGTERWLRKAMILAIW